MLIKTSNSTTTSHQSSVSSARGNQRRYNRRNTLAIQFAPGISDPEQASFWEAISRTIKVQPTFITTKPGSLFKIVDFGYPLSTGQKVDIEGHMSSAIEIMDFGKAVNLSGNDFYLQTKYIQFPLGFKGITPELLKSESLTYALDLMSFDRGLTLKMTSNVFDHGVHVDRLKESIGHLGIVPRVREQVYLNALTDPIDTTNSVFNQQLNLKLIRAEEAWEKLQVWMNDSSCYLQNPPYNLGTLGQWDDGDITFGSQNIAIGILDDGVESQLLGGFETGTVPGLMGDVTGNGKKALGFLRRNGVFIGDNHVTSGAHGTSVAGLALGKAITDTGGNSGQFLGEMVFGVAPNCPYAAVDHFTVNHTFIGLTWLTQSGLNTINSNTGIPLSKGMDIINMSFGAPSNGKMYNENIGTPTSNTPTGIFDASRFGRNGKGTLLVAASGNDGSKDILSEQTFAQYPETLVVGGTSYYKRNNGKLGEEWTTTSNYGDRLDLVGPAGGQERNDYDSNEAFAPTPIDAGSFGGEVIKSATVNGSISNNINDVTFDLTSTESIYEGMRVSIGNTGNEDFEARTISKISNNTITCQPRFYYSHGSNEDIKIYGVSTVLEEFEGVSSTSIKVKSIKGFSDFENGNIDKQKIYLGEAGPNGEECTIDYIVSNNDDHEIFLENPTQKQHSAGSIVVAGTLQNEVKSKPTVTRPYMWVELSSVDGFFPGLGITVTISETIPRYLNSNVHKVDRINNSIQIKTPPSAGKIPPEGAKVLASGGGNYRSTFDGTSAAAPIVSGVAALVLSARPDLSYLEVKDILKRSCDKLELDQEHLWKSKTNDWVIDSGFVAVSPTTALANFPSVGDEVIDVTNSSGFEVDQVIQMSSTQGDEEAVIWKVDNTNDKLFLKNKVLYAHTNPTSVKGGHVAYRADKYGAGRVNAERAVEEAIAYSHDQRDLAIRDVSLSENINTATTGTVDSPDIWVRNVHPDADSNQIPLSTQSGNIKHQSPKYNENRWVYVRVKNYGNLYESLDGCSVIVSITYTKDPTANIDFEFPRMWHTGHFGVHEEDHNGYKYTTRVLSLWYNNQWIGQYQQDLLSGNPKNARPEMLPVIPPGGDSYVVIPWRKEDQPENPSDYRVFVKAHITPFDGKLAGNQAASNSNLSFKEVLFECNCAVLNDPNGSEYIAHEVPADGTTATETIVAQFINTVDSADVNDLEIEVLRTKKDLTTETTTYKYTGSWGFTTTQTYATFNGAPSTPGGTGLLSYVKFDGSITLDNTDKSVKIFLKKSGVTWDTQLIGVVTKFNFALDGIAQNKIPLIHSFTDFDLLPSQPGNNNYGSISPVEYRTSALFSGINSGSVLPAYAAADGEVFIVEVSSSQVNLVLKPRVQPSDRFSPVKYFVYRGLKHSSFLDGTNEPAPVGASGLITEMHQVTADFNAAHSGVSGFIPITLKRSDLGIAELIDPPIPTDMTLEVMFDKYTFKKVNAGDHIGDFEVTEEYGFQVLVEAPNYRHTIGDLSVIDHLATISYVGGQPQFSAGQEEDISTKFDREKILGYIDPAAYYGNLFNEKVVVHQGGGSSEITGNDIYDLIGSKFATLDKVYVDIRNAYNNSLNFYGSFGSGGLANHAKIKFHNASNNWVVREYHDGNGWPILVLSQSDFPSSTSVQKQDLRVKLPEGSNSFPMIVLHGSSYYETFPAESGVYRIRSILSSYTRAIKLGIPNNDAVGRVYPQTVRMSYNHRHDTTNLPTVSFPATRLIKDDLLDLLMTFDDIAFDQIPGQAIWKSLADSRYVGWSSKHGLKDFMTQTGMAKDDLGVILMATRTGEIEDDGVGTNLGVRTEPNLSVGRVRQISFYNALMDPLILSWVHKANIDLGTLVPCLIVDSISSTYSDDILEQSTDDLFTLAISADQYQDILTIINANFLAGSSKYLSVINHELNEDNNGIPYYSFDVGIQGIVYDSGTYSHNIEMVNASITVYSLDGRNYFSEDYSAAWITANS